MRLPLIVVVPLLFMAAGCIGGSSSSSAGTTRPAVVCSTATVHYGGVPAAARKAGIPSGVPWVEDSVASVTGSLFYYTPTLRRRAGAIIGTLGQAESETATKILWWVHGKGSPTLTIVGNRTDGAGSFRQTITGPSLGDSTTFPSIVKVPSPGCWTLAIHSGSTSGSMTFRASRLRP
jgi:hypothetical protein